MSLPRAKREPWQGTWRLAALFLAAVPALTLYLQAFRPGVRLWGAPGAMILLAAGGCIYLAAAMATPRRRLGKADWLLIVLTALLMRTPLWWAPSRDQDDYHRYLWDGAVVARGLNPYAVAPGNANSTDHAPPELAALARQSEAAETIRRINHPHLRTMYPPAAQCLFAGAALIRPFSLTAWRATLAAFDALSLVAVLLSLRRLRRPASQCVLYLWNPLIVWETYVGGHLDLAAAALAVLGVALLLHRRSVAAAATLTLAIGMKLWPVLLVPFVLSAARRRRRALWAIATMLVVAAPMAWWYASALGADSGLQTYAHTWRSHAGAFLLIRRVARVATAWVPSAELRTLARGIAAGLAFAGAALLAGRSGRRLRDAARLIPYAPLLGLLLSPTLYPWYYLAVVPLAALAPSPALLAWSALLPLAYTPLGQGEPSTQALVLHVPVWAMLAIQTGRGITRKRKIFKGGEPCSTTAS